MTCTMREPTNRCILTDGQCAPDSDTQKKCGLFKHTKEAVSAAKAILKGKAAGCSPITGKADSWDVTKGGNGSKPPVKTPKKKATDKIARVFIGTTADTKSKPRTPKIKK